jgi:hypothetical protein
MPGLFLFMKNNIIQFGGTSKTIIIMTNTVVYIRVNRDQSVASCHGILPGSWSIYYVSPYH